MLFALLAIFLVLVAIRVVVSVIQQRTAEDSEQYRTPIYDLVFTDFETADIQAIRLQSPNGERSFTIARAADGISWIAPENEGVLDQNIANGIATTMILLPSFRAIPITDEINLVDYGFNPAGYMFITVLLVDGTSHIVAIGGMNIMETAYYALVDERPEIYVVERAAIAFLIAQLVETPIN